MKVTTEEARKKWCPMAGREAEDIMCLANGCMWFKCAGQQLKGSLERGTEKMVEVFECKPHS